MKEFWSKRARDLVPYTPGEQPRQRNWIKLNTNENPYPPSQKALAAIRAAAGETLRLYPDPECTSLREALAATFDLKPAQVFVGNGSDEVLALCFQAFFDPERTILFPDVTYSFYPVFADLYGLSYREVPLDERFGLPLESFVGDNGGVVIANPNAPTGRAVSLCDIRTLLEGNPESVVIVDEAYIDFGGVSALELVNEYDNLLVVRTYSKSRSMAGLRVGFAIGHPDLIKALNDVKYSFNSYTMDAFSLALGAETLKDTGYFEECMEKIIRTRAWTAKELTRLGFVFPEPMANFIFASHPDIPAEELFARLREQDIYVRYFPLPRIDNYLRITIGTDEQMKTLIRFLEKYINDRK